MDIFSLIIVIFVKITIKSNLKKYSLTFLKYSTYSYHDLFKVCLKYASYDIISNIYIKDTILPSHYELAFYKANIDVNQWIYNNFSIPEEEIKKMIKKHTKFNNPFDNSRIIHSLELNEWIYGNNYPLLFITHNYITTCISIEVLEWLYDKKYTIHNLTFLNSCEMNSLVSCKWLYNHNIFYFPFTMNIAIKNKNIEMCQWLYSIGCPWEDNSYKKTLKTNCKEIILWLESIGCH